MSLLNKILLLLLFLHGSISLSLAQENRYVVYFTDKVGSQYTTANPEAYLSERAIERRINQEIAITEEDLPVNPWYVDSLREKGAEVFYTSRWFNAALIQATAQQVEHIKQISIVDSVAYAAPGAKLTNGRISTFDVKQFNATGTDQQNAFHNIDSMHTDGYTGEGIWVAIFDGGFLGVNEMSAFSHLYNDNKLIMTKDLIRNNNEVYQYDKHGTYILGLVNAKSENHTSGAYDASIGLFITEDVYSEYRIEEYNWLFAAEMADSAGFDIINTSLGYSNFFDDPAMHYTYEDMDGSTAIITIASNKASARGILIITSAGNEGDKDWKYITAPGDARNNITVGAVAYNKKKTVFSSIGPTSDGRIKPDISALGSQVILLEPNGELAIGSGTSYAAPFVTSIAAGTWQKYRDYSMLEIRELLLSWGTRYQNPNELVGNGILTYEPGIITDVDQPEPHFKIYPNPVEEKLYIINAPKDASIRLITPYGITTSPTFKDVIINMSGFPDGLYLIEIKSGNSIFHHKIIKK